MFINQNTDSKNSRLHVSLLYHPRLRNLFNYMLDFSDKDWPDMFCVGNFIFSLKWFDLISEPWKSSLPELDAIAPRHLYCPFTSGVCWVTLQGYVTLSPLDDTSTCYSPKENCNYFHLVHSHSCQIFVYHSGAKYFFIIASSTSNVTCCVRGQIISQKNDEMAVSNQPLQKTWLLTSCWHFFWYVCSFENYKKQNKILEILQIDFCRSLLLKRDQRKGWNQGLIWFNGFNGWSLRLLKLVILAKH